MGLFRKGSGLGPRGSGIALRLAILLMITLLVVLGVSAGWYAKDRADTARRLAFHTSRQIVRIVDLLDATPPVERPHLVRALSGPTLGVRLMPGPPPPVRMDDHDSEEHERVMSWARRLFRDLGDKPLVIVPLDDWRGRPFQEMDEPRDGDHHARRPRPPLDEQPDLFPSRRKAIVATTLNDGTWAHFLIATDIASFQWAFRTVFWLSSFGLLIVLFSFLAAHRATRPLRRFAEAADRLGVDVDSPPLEEAGSRELRRTAVAFNRMQQRIKRLLDDRTLMLAALSHDLKTMLTRLRLRAEFIDDQDQQDKAVRDIDDMQQMVDAALGFVRGDQASEAVVRFELATMLQDLADDYRAAGEDVDYAGPERLAVDGRPVALKRAIGNLVENAVRYGGSAGIGLAAGPERIEITVSDSGPGLPEQELERVFQPFYRVETSRSRETGGSGLGLPLARDVFRRLGGDLVLENRREGGLVARAWLPVGTGR
ncbi:MAG: ATP-binding protein [Pseudomonadota bacterium]|nr:ATP-binding protein [Pseudomonadota bacterium]